MDEVSASAEVRILGCVGIATHMGESEEDMVMIEYEKRDIWDYQLY